jgi:hypothetical protein
MKRILLAALIACAPVAAAALSCMPHSVEAAFQEAQADQTRFVIVRGRLEFDVRKLPRVNYMNQRATPDLTLVAAKLTGASLSDAGFITPYSKPVTLAVSCYGPWCASVQQGSEVLAFVALGTGGNMIATNPCGGYLFGTPTPKMIRTVKSCFAGKTCVPVR